MRAAARAAIAVRPIPREAVVAGATVAAVIALRRVGLDEKAERLQVTQEVFVGEQDSPGRRRASGPPGMVSARNAPPPLSPRLGKVLAGGSLH